MVIRHRTKFKLFEGYILTRSFVGFVFVFFIARQTKYKFVVDYIFVLLRQDATM